MDQSSNNDAGSTTQQQEKQQPQQPQQTTPVSKHKDDMIDHHDDPLLIAQSLTYVTDDGSVVLSFMSAPFSWGFKFRFILLETIFVLLCVAAVPIGAHGTVVSVSVGNLLAVAWFWYNSVRSVDITSDGGLRFWIGNVEIDVPFDKIVTLRRIANSSACSAFSLPLFPHRGFLSTPTDGVAIVTSVPSTPFFMWPRSAGRPERTCCWGKCGCPRLTVVFSPAGGGLNFIREVENEMRNSVGGGGGRPANKQMQQPPSYVPAAMDSSHRPPGTTAQEGNGSAGGGGRVSGDFFDV